MRRQRHDEARNCNLWIHQRDEVVYYPAAANAIGAKFNDAIGRHLCARGFNVNDDKIQFLKQSRFGVIRLQFDRVAIDDLEPPIILYQIADQQAR